MCRHGQIHTLIPELAPGELSVDLLRIISNPVIIVVLDLIPRNNRTLRSRASPFSPFESL